MKKLFLSALLSITCVFFMANGVLAHCEIPCGIYDDEMRIAMLLEHVATIEKSMQQIMELEKADKHDSNQLIRWVMNKDDHAEQFQEIVSRYFMTQRIKPDAKEYTKKITSLHQMLVYAMKCKQTTDVSNVEKLRDLIKEFKALYFSGN